MNISNDLLNVPARLAILAFLSTADAVGFSTLVKEIGLTSGNLSTHLSKLENADMISITKSFVNKRPRTTIKMTLSGREVFINYVSMMEKRYANYRKNVTT